MISLSYFFLSLVFCNFNSCCPKLLQQLHDQLQLKIRTSHVSLNLFFIISQPFLPLLRFFVNNLQLCPIQRFCFLFLLWTLFPCRSPDQFDLITESISQNNTFSGYALLFRHLFWQTFSHLYLLNRHAGNGIESYLAQIY